MVKRKKITAGELMEELMSDPEWVRGYKAREAARLEREAEFRKESEPLLKDLAAAGHPVSSVYDLVNTREPYRSAIPVLVAHFQKPYHPIIREGIARALTVPDARGIATVEMLTALKEQGATDSYLRSVFANALSVIATPEIAADLKSLIEDTSFADVRELLREALTGPASHS